MRFPSLKNQNGSLIPGVLLGLALACVIGAGLYWCGTHYIVNTRDGLKFYPKPDFSFEPIYVDMKQMTFMDLRGHTRLVKAMALERDLEYLPGGEALEAVARAGKSVTEAVRTFETEHQLSQSLKQMAQASSERLKQADQDYRVSDSIREAARISREKAGELSEKYQVKKKMATANQKVKEGARKFNAWLKSQKPAESGE